MSNYGVRRDGTFRIRLDGVSPKPLEEVLAEHDVSWVDKDNRDYRVVTDEDEFESLMSDFESRGAEEIVAYDTETTGLHINCMGKRKSSYEKSLKDYYDNGGKDEYLCDRLVGLIFCVDEGKSYYFSVASLEYHNLFELDEDTLRDPDATVKIRAKRKDIIDECITRYNASSYKTPGVDEDLWRYFRGLSHELHSVKPDERQAIYDSVDCDIVIMERLRRYFATHLFVGQNVGFDWKVTHQYGIDVHFAHDTLQLAKHIGKDLEDGISLKTMTHNLLHLPQLELSDFFNLKKDKQGYVNLSGYEKNKAPLFANFSCLGYEASRYYAPADGDMTLQILHLLLRERKEKNLEGTNTAYQIDVMAAMAVGYVEFYGHMLDVHGMKAVEIYRSFLTIQAEHKFWASLDTYSGKGNFECAEEIKVLSGLDDLIAESFELTKGGPDVTDEVLAEYEQKLTDLTEAYEKAKEGRDLEKKFSIGSPAQVTKLFYDVLGYTLKEGMKPGVGKDPMRWLKSQRGSDNGNLPGVHEYADYQNAKSVVVKFCKSMPYFAYPNGLVSPSFNSNGTDTGRMSCSKPNAQQYPEEVTRLIFPRPGFVMADCDYSQIESRVITSLAREMAMAEYFADPDMDYHTRMASMLFNVPYEQVDKAKRKQSKSLNFGIPYGMGIRMLAAQLFGGNTNEECCAIASQRQAAYFRVQPGIKKLFDKAIAQGKTYAIHTAFGRTRYLEPIPDIRKKFEARGKLNEFSESGFVSKYERFSKNTVIQGTAADIFKLGLSRNFRFIREYNLYGKVCLFDLVHDEQCMEIDTTQLDAVSVVAALANNMKIDVEGWCPLYAAATLGHELHGAKKDEEVAIHPTELQHLVRRFGLTTEDYSPWREDGKTYEVPAGDPEAVLTWYHNMQVEFNKEYVCHKLIKMYGDYEEQLPSAYADLLSTVGVCTKKDESGKKYIDMDDLADLLRTFLRDLPEKASKNDYIAKLVTDTDYMLGSSMRKIVYLDEELCKKMFAKDGYKSLFDYALQKIDEGKPAEQMAREKAEGLDELDYSFAYIPTLGGTLSKRMLETLTTYLDEDFNDTIYEELAEYVESLLHPGELMGVTDEEEEEEWDEETLAAFGEGTTTGDIFYAARTAAKFGFVLHGTVLIIKECELEKLEWFLDRDECKEFTAQDATIMLLPDDVSEDVSSIAMQESEDKVDLQTCIAFVHWCRDGYPSSPWETKSLAELGQDPNADLRYLWYQIQ